MKIGLAAAMAIATAFLGGCIGFSFAWLLAVRSRVVDGPPAGVLFVVSVLGFAAVTGLFGLLATWRWMQKRWPEGQRPDSGKLAFAIVGLLVFAGGIRWLQIFMFTDYRPPLIPFGVAALAVGSSILMWSMGGLRRTTGPTAR